MKYILDFDRVLFDTDAFIAELEKEGLGEMDRDEALVTLINEKGIDLKEFVNEGVVDFLSKHKDDCIIVSSYVSRNRGDNDTSESDLVFFQNEKIRLSGLDVLVSEVIVTGETKLTELENIYKKYDGEATLIDDEKDHIAHAKEIGFDTFWVRTPKNLLSSAEGVPDFVESKQLSSFAEFTKLHSNE